MKKILSYIGVVILSLFSFYYTDKAGEIVRKNDPIMKEVMANKDSYSVEAVNAIIDGDYIISGINGKEIEFEILKGQCNHNGFMKSRECSITCPCCGSVTSASELKTQFKNLN